MPTITERDTTLRASGIKQSLHALHTLNRTDVIQQRIEARDVLHIEAYRTLEYSIVRMYIYCAHIYAEVCRNHARQIEDNSRAVDTSYLNRGEI